MPADFAGPADPMCCVSNRETPQARTLLSSRAAFGFPGAVVPLLRGEPDETFVLSVRCAGAGPCLGTRARIGCPPRRVPGDKAPLQRGKRLDARRAIRQGRQAAGQYREEDQPKPNNVVRPEGGDPKPWNEKCRDDQPYSQSGVQQAAPSSSTGSSQRRREGQHPNRPRGHTLPLGVRPQEGRKE